MKTCSICDRPFYGRGFCKMHYSRWRAHGDPNIVLTGGGRQRVAACTICGDPVEGRGWCRMHWKRWRRHGDPLETRFTPRGLAQRFLEAAVNHLGDECLPWPYGTQKSGYGAVPGRTASNLMCEMVHGPAPEGKPEAAHACDNPICVNPNHLRWASHAENMADRKGHDLLAKS